MEDLFKPSPRREGQDCRRWLDLGLELPIAVNISARNLLDGEFPELVATCGQLSRTVPGRDSIQHAEARFVYVRVDRVWPAIGPGPGTLLAARLEGAMPVKLV